MSKYVILGHENPDLDSIISGYLLEKIMKLHQYDVEFIIPDADISEENIALANYCGISPNLYQKPLSADSTIKYILVDHHERNVPGEIVAIIDHHPTDKEIKAPYYQNEPACSTSCLIARENEHLLTVDDLKATCLSAMVDTAAFHSNKTVMKDALWVKELCSKHNFDYEELLTISMCPTDISNPITASTNGLKKHHLSGYNVASSFLHLPNPSVEEQSITQMLEYLKDYRKDNDYSLFAFIIHDITNFTSRVYKIYEDKIDIVDYDEYTSRGTRIIPEITEELKTYQKKKTSSLN